MTWDEAFTCDVCGREKRVVNHWWMVRLGEADCCEEDQPLRSFILLPWDASVCRSPGIYHLCGGNCATKAMERFMTTGSLDVDAHQRSQPRT